MCSLLPHIFCFSLLSLSLHSLPTLFLFLTDNYVVLPLSPNLSSSTGPLLHLVGSLLLHQPALPRERDGEPRVQPGLGYSSRLWLITQLHLTLKSSWFYRMQSTMQNFFWYYLTTTAGVTVLNTYGFTEHHNGGFIFPVSNKSKCTPASWY